MSEDTEKGILMEFVDYRKLPKLRTFITPEIREILERDQILKDMNLLSWNKSRYKTGKRSLPIKYLYKNPKMLSKIMKLQPVFITHGGVKVILPNRINRDIAYLTGFICGDGSLFISKKRDYIVTIHNKERKILERILTILKENFNYKAKIKEGHECLVMEIRSEVIHSFFHKIMEIETGTKKNIKIPDKIKDSRELIRAFIAGFFDAEGCVALKRNNITCQISISQKQKHILEEIKSELEADNIRMRFHYYPNCWILYGNRESLKPFYDKIPFSHSKKKIKLETAIRNHSLWKSGNSSKIC